MISEIHESPVLAEFLDALGRRVTAEVTRAGTVAIFARSPDKGLDGGHPCLSEENARLMGNALLAFADRKRS